MVANKLKSFVIQSSRVWRILKKPSKQEYILVSKVSALGILAVGLIGFIISAMIKSFS